MTDKNSLDVINPEIMEDVLEDLLKIFGSNKEYLTKSECREILNIVFEALFDEKLKTKNFNYIFKLISKNDHDSDSDSVSASASAFNKKNLKEKIIKKSDLEPVIRSFIVCFDVNYITNSSAFNDKVCIKIGKHLLPITYYIKKSNE
jgi:hypothetical protein